MSVTRLPFRPVQTLRPSSTIAEAARAMYMGTATALPIMDEANQRLLGMITERDVVATIAEGLDPEKVTVEQRLQATRGYGSNDPSPDIWFS